MPEAKRNKLVSLTRVKPKTRDHKSYIVKRVQSYLARYKYLYVLTYENMSTNNFKNIKQTLTDSKFMMGKNKVIGIAFGKQEESFKSNSYRVAEDLKGHCVLFFTNKKKQECQQIFKNFEEEEFATGGVIATETIVLQKGFETLKKFTHSMQPYLRQQGLPTRLVNSQIELLSDYLLAEQSKPMTVQKCKILKLLDKKMSRLKFNIKGMYDGKNYKKY